jgi:hypothetical protein
MRHSDTVYVRDGQIVWAFPKVEFRVAFQARSRGITTEDGDFDRMGRRLKDRTFRASHQKKYLCLDVTGWVPSQYAECLSGLSEASPRGVTYPNHER